MSAASLTAAAKLRGDFALAAMLDDGLLLARGLFGGRSLYYARDDDGDFVACSRLSPLLRTLARAPSLDVAKVTAMVAWGWATTRSGTLFEEVHRVESGEVLAVGNTVERAVAVFEATAFDCRSTEEFSSELRTQVSAAVARAVDGTKRVGVLVSGGIDSSVVLAALVAQERGASRREVDAIVLDFPESNDRPYLRDLMDAFGMVPIAVSPEAAARNTARALVMDGAPFLSPAGSYNLALLEVLAARGVDVVLTGVGGDDFFDGDLGVFPARFLRGDVVGALISAARMKAVYWWPTPLERMDQLVLRPVLKKIPGLRAGWRSLTGRVPPQFSWAGPKLKEYLANPPTGDLVPTKESTSSTEVRLRALAYSQYLLDLSDSRAQLEATSGCVQRDPLLDTELAAFVAQIPPDLIMFGHQLRGLLRHAFRDLLPARLRRRESKGHLQPVFAAHLRALQHSGELSDLVRMSTLSELGIVRPAPFGRAVDRLLGDPFAGFGVIWPALAVEAFAGQHVAASRARSFRGAASSVPT